MQKNRLPEGAMLLLTTAALPQLEQHDHPNLGRLITPRHYRRLADTLAAGYPVAADNDCFQGLDATAVCAMLEADRAMAERRRADPASVAGMNGAGRDRASAARAATVFEEERLPAAASEPAVDRGPRRGRRRRRHARTVPRMAHVAVPPGSSPTCCRTAPSGPAGCRGMRPAWPPCSSAAARAGSSGPMPPGLCAKRGRAACWPTWAGFRARERIRYARSIGCTSFDSSRYSRWRELLLDDGLACASQPPQLRLVA